MTKTRRHSILMIAAFALRSAVFAESPQLAGNERHVVVTPGVDAVVPQLVDGSGWKTSIFVTNLDSKPINFVVLFFRDDGELLRLPIERVGDVAAVYGTLGVNASGLIETAGAAANLSQGYALVLTTDRLANDPAAKPTQDRIGGMAVFRLRSASRGDSEAVVPFSPVNETQMVLPFDNRSGFSTGIAVVNPDMNNAATVEFAVRAESGALIKQEGIRIPAGGKVTFSLPDRFPETSGLAGRLNLRTTGTYLSALGLRFNPSGSFTSFHALSLDVTVVPPVAPPTTGGNLPGVAQNCIAITKRPDIR